ncbi:MAG: hypothetical protein ACOC0P_04745, partial [Planctomycetota bacterium]
NGGSRVVAGDALGYAMAGRQGQVAEPAVYLRGNPVDPGLPTTLEDPGSLIEPLTIPPDRIRNTP